MQLHQLSVDISIGVQFICIDVRSACNTVMAVLRMWLEMHSILQCTSLLMILFCIGKETFPLTWLVSKGHRIEVKYFKYLKPEKCEVLVNVIIQYLRFSVLVGISVNINVYVMIIVIDWQLWIIRTWLMYVIPYWWTCISHVNIHNNQIICRSAWHICQTWLSLAFSVFFVFDFVDHN